MTTNLPSRQQIENAGELDFTPRGEKQANISLTAGPAGITVTIEWTGPVSGIPSAIERLKQAGVLELVSAATTKAIPAEVHTPARKGAAMITTPAYDGSGQAMCPVHRKPLADGRYGQYCPSRAEGEHANAKGYCNIRFTE